MEVYTFRYSPVLFVLGFLEDVGVNGDVLNERGRSRAVESQLGPRGDSQNWTPLRKFSCGHAFQSS